MVKEIPLQNGMVALVDDEDFEKVKDYTWYHQAGNEAVRTMVNRTIIYLGRLILNCHDMKKHVCQREKNLDYRKSNLIILETGKTSRMKRSQKGSSSKYKGVSWDKKQGKWAANIRVNGKLIYLGRYINEDEAAKVYNKASLEYFGENAYRNKIGEENFAPTYSETQPKLVKTARRRTNKSGYRGVYFDKGKYQSEIRHKGRKINLGRHILIEEAAKAYDQKAYELYGDEAILNFPELKSEYEQALAGE